MLTILAWIVFIPAIAWNIPFFCIAFIDIMSNQTIKWANKRNLRDLIISLAVLLIPGIYLFGLF